MENQLKNMDKKKIFQQAAKFISILGVGTLLNAGWGTYAITSEITFLQIFSIVIGISYLGCAFFVYRQSLLAYQIQLGLFVIFTVVNFFYSLSIGNNLGAVVGSTILWVAFFGFVLVGLYRNILNAEKKENLDNPERVI